MNRGPNIGHCVICGIHGKLSRDHVPPKACNNLNDVELKTLHPTKEHSNRGTTSQGGSHYKTLCNKCNSTELGINYDPSLVDLSNEITSLVIGAKNKNISLPKKIYPFIRPQKIARSIVGHCLAAIAIEESKTGLISTPIGDTLRKYFLDPSAPLPEELDIYYWPYPSNQQVIIKNIGKSSIHHSGIIFGHIIKFLPLGFWLVWNKPHSIQLNINQLVPNKSMGIDEVQQIEIDLYNIPNFDFPEAPMDHEIVAFNDNYSVVANQKTKRK